MTEGYPTPHINAQPSDFAKTVLMPGDPLRSKFIAVNFLTDAKLINNVRGVRGYTGYYNGKQISVMASGMGMPSIGIYAYELYNIFNVENIIRVGSAGALNAGIHLRDIVMAQGASTDSNFADQYHLPGTFSPICSYGILKKCIDTAEQMKLRYHVGNILSTDRFYSDEENVPDGLKSNEVWAKMGIMAVEMEAAALYMTAARCGKKALAVCTVSDNIITGETTTAEERQNSFTDMIELAMKTAVKL